jgi:hypothetical protein
MNTNVVFRVASLARKIFHIPLPLALKLPFGVWGQGRTVGQVVRQNYRM